MNHENDSHSRLQDARKMKGYLQKKSRSIFGNWLTRYFMIVDNALEYYDDQERKYKKGDILIKQIAGLIPRGAVEFEFDYNGRKYQMKCSDERTRDRWLTSIATIQESLARNLSPKIPKSPKKIRQNERKLKSVQTIKSSTGQVRSFLQRIKLSKLIQTYPQEQIYTRLINLTASDGIYWLISFKPLEFIDSDYVVFLQSDVSPYDLNTLYFIPDGGEVMQVCRTDQMARVIDDPSELTIEIVDKESLVIDTQIIPMVFSKKFDRNLRKAIEVGKQYFNPYGIVLTQNIDPLIRCFDVNFTSLDSKILRQFKESQIRKFGNHSALEFFSNLKSAVCLIKRVNDECRVKVPDRMDVFEYCCRTLHPEIYRMLFEGWNSLHNDLSSDQIGKLSGIVIQYENMVKPYLQDSRLKEGAIMLFRIYIRKVEASMIQTIEQNLKISQSIERDGILANTANSFILNSMEQDFSQIKERSAGDMSIILEVIRLTKRVFKYYCERIIEQSTVWTNKDLLLGSCNDVELILTFMRKIIKKDFIKTQEEEANFERKYQKELSHYLLNAKINLIKKVFLVTFSSIDRKILNRNLGEIDMGAIVNAIQAKINKLDRVTQDVRTHIYLTSFDEVCYFYFSCIVKFPNIECFTSVEIGKKIDNDLGRIQTCFLKILHEDKISFNLNDLDLLKQIIVCGHMHLMSSILQAKKTFGNALSQEVLKNIVNLRGGSTEIKAKLFQDCISLLGSGAGSESSDSYGRRQSFLDTWNQSRSRTATLTRDQNQLQTSQIQVLKLVEQGKRGFLLKKKILKTIPSIFVKCYFRLQAGKLFEYESENSNVPSGIIRLSEIETCFIHPDDYKIIGIELKEAVYQFKARSAQEANSWLEKIQEEAGVRRHIRHQDELFKDYFSGTSTQPASAKKISNSPRKLKKKMSEGMGCACQSFLFL